jgi:hypothetical protein
MKSINKIGLLFVIAWGITACNNYDWDVDHTTTLSPLIITSDDITTDITVNYRDSTSNLGNTYLLSWDSVHAADYSTIFYEVLFYTTDETKPFYIGKTEVLQTENFLKLNDQSLNLIAEKAAIPQNATGKIYWKVHASNGVNDILSTEKRTITVSRPAGYVYYPERVYVTGDATQAGELEDGRYLLKKVMRDTTIAGNKIKLFEGEYEAFVYLKEGKFTLKEGGLTRYFFISENNELSELFGEDVQNKGNVPIKKDKIHYLRLNFNKSTASLFSVEAIEMWYSGIGDTWGELTQSDSKIPRWNLTRKIELVNYPATSPDYRYKFRLSETDRNGNAVTAFWGASVKTALNISASTEDSYFELKKIDDSRSDFCYKFSREGHDGKTMNIVVDFQSTTEYYRHYLFVNE